MLLFLTIPLDLSSLLRNHETTTCLGSDLQNGAKGRLQRGDIGVNLFGRKQPHLPCCTCMQEQKEGAQGWLVLFSPEMPSLRCWWNDGEQKGKRGENNTASVIIRMGVWNMLCAKSKGPLKKVDAKI